MGKTDQEPLGRSKPCLPLEETPNQKQVHLTPSPMSSSSFMTLELTFLDFSVPYHNGLSLESLTFTILYLLGA